MNWNRELSTPLSHTDRSQTRFRIRQRPLASADIIQRVCGLLFQRADHLPSGVCNVCVSGRYEGGGGGLTNNPFQDYLVVDSELIGN